MLSLSEFSAGELRSASPVSLMLPLAEHDGEFLIAGSKDAPVAIFLRGEYAFRHFESASSEDWTGLIIPNVAIEVDEGSAFNAPSDRPTPGDVVRRGAELAMCVMRDRGNGTNLIALASDLPAIGEMQVGFRRWQVVLGEGRLKRVIREFDSSKKTT
jgi:hypothetical protein